MPIVTRQNPQSGRFGRVHHRCSSCQIVRINGVVCHETGCPEAWKDSLRECKECGTEFVPTERAQACCDDDCMRMYHGF